MDVLLCGSSTTACMRISLVVRADLVDTATRGLSHQSIGNCSAHCSVARSSASEASDSLPSAPLPLPSFQSTFAVPPGILWFTKKSENPELQLSLNTLSPNSCARPPVHLPAATGLTGGDIGSLQIQDLAECTEVEPSAIDADAHPEKPGCLKCRCSTEDFEGSDAGLQQADSGSCDRELFTKYLRHVHLAELEVVSQLSFLCNLAYMIPEIEPFDLLGQHQLAFVTSSLHHKVGANGPAIGLTASKGQSAPGLDQSDKQDGVLGKLAATLTSERVQVAAKVASLFWNIGPNSEISGGQVRPHGDAATTLISKDIAVSLLDQESRQSASGLDHSATDVVSFLATSSSAAVVSPGDVPKMPGGGIVQMHQSCPCEWFICDDQDNHIRNFVIQGSESLESWQANILFEPVQFEDPGLHVLVHRGIYEAAKGLYEQLLPHILEHVGNCQGSGGSQIRFTGHSLGGSLATLISLMLHIRGVVPKSCLLPVVTFGSPAILCGGDALLHKLGLPPSHVQSIVMHRDIVPRSFSCDFPDHVAEILRRINGTFRDHPCLADERQLYAPIGQLMILQPDNRQSPSHPLLPSGSGLYVLTSPNEEVSCRAELQAAQRAFLNSPHPLEILSEPGAYGSEGTIARDHDPRGYARAINHVLRREHKQLRRRRREQRRQLWWPLVCKDVPSRQLWRQDTLLACGRTRHDNWKKKRNVEAVYQVRLGT